MRISSDDHIGLSQFRFRSELKKVNSGAPLVIQHVYDLKDFYCLLLLKRNGYKNR